MFDQEELESIALAISAIVSSPSPKTTASRSLHCSKQTSGTAEKCSPPAIKYLFFPLHLIQEIVCNSDGLFVIEQLYELRITPIPR